MREKEREKHKKMRWKGLPAPIIIWAAPNYNNKNKPVQMYRAAAQSSKEKEEIGWVCLEKREEKNG